MKIAHITPSFAPAYCYGGPVLFAEELTDAFAALGHSVRVLTTDSDGSSSRLDVPPNRYIRAKENIEVCYCSTHLWETNSLSLPMYLSKEIRWADLILISGIFSPSVISAVTMCRAFGRGAIVLPHGSLMKACLSKHSARKQMWLSALRCFLHRKTVFQAGSSIEADDIVSVFPKSDTYVIPPGVSSPQRIRERSARQDRLRILYLGRLHPIKGIENLIRACSALNRDGFRAWSLKVAGSGDPNYTNDLHTLTRQLGVQANVAFLGSVTRSELPDIFENSDVTVVPSYSENFCRVVAESLSYGVPVIASIYTPWNQIERVGCGFFVDNTPQELALALRSTSSADLVTMGRVGADWIRKQFNWASCAEKFVALAASLSL